MTKHFTSFLYVKVYESKFCTQSHGSKVKKDV